VGLPPLGLHTSKSQSQAKPIARELPSWFLLGPSFCDLYFGEEVTQKVDRGKNKSGSDDQQNPTRAVVTT